MMNDNDIAELRRELEQDGNKRVETLNDCELFKIRQGIANDVDVEMLELMHANGVNIECGDGVPQTYIVR